MHTSLVMCLVCNTNLLCAAIDINCHLKSEATARESHENGKIEQIDDQNEGQNDDQEAAAEDGKDAE